MDKPPVVVHLRKWKYDKALEESNKATDAIEPPPVNALHKAVKQQTQKRWAAELRISQTPEARTHARKMAERSKSMAESASKAFRNSDDYPLVPMPRYEPPPTPRKRKKRMPAGHSHRREFDKLMREIILKQYAEGKFTRKRGWTEERGFYWIFTATPEHTKEILGQ